MVQLEPPATDQLANAVRRSELAWRTLGQRIRSITPRQLARSVLVLGALAVIVWVVSLAWSELLPFQLGLVLAYITMPVVNWLDKFIPRWSAATFLVLLELAAIVLGIGLLVPPLAGEFTALLASLPDPDRVQALLADARSALLTLPPPVQELVRNGVEQLTNNIRSNASTYVQGALEVALATLLGLFSTIGFVIGFLGVPTWLVSVMTDQDAGKRAINRFLPTSTQPDFWAVVRILDRTFSAFVRGQLLYGVITAIIVYIGFAALERLGLSAGNYRVVLAAVAGLAQLIPAVGPILGAIPAVAVALTESPNAALATLAMYVAAQFILGTFIAPHVTDRYVDIHPAVFVIVLVLLSQFGFLWVFLAAPVSIVLRDLFRYVYGRLSEPPRPAGVAPGESAAVPVTRRLVRTSQGEAARG